MTDVGLVGDTPGGPVGPVAGLRGHRGHLGRWLVRRLALGVVTLVAVSLVVFFAAQALPSNPARAILGRTATPQAVAALEMRLGLNKPLTSQYLHWFSGVVQGGFGTSIVNGQPVSALISDRIVNSLTLLLVAAFIALPLSFLLGAATAVVRGPIDNAFLLGAVVVSALPDFVIAIVLGMLFATTLFHFLPAVSLIPPGSSPLDHPTDLILPIMALVALNVPYLYRLVRTSMIDVLGSEYVAMARLKGMPQRIVVMRHALRNALLPAIQGSGIVLGWMLGSVVVVETVFQYPGLGSALRDAVQARDLPVIQAIVLVIAVGVVLFNLTADAMTVWLTPKLRTRGVS